MKFTPHFVISQHFFKTNISLLDNIQCTKRSSELRADRISELSSVKGKKLSSVKGEEREEGGRWRVYYKLYV